MDYADATSRNAVTGPDGNLLNPDPNGDGIAGILHVDPRYWRIDDDKTRNGVNLIAQWQPSDAVEVSYDLLYADFTSHRDRRWQATFMAFGPHTNAVLNENEVLVSGTVNRPWQNNVEYMTADASMTSHDLTGVWHINDDVTLSAQATINRAEQSIDRQFVRYQTVDRLDITYDFNAEWPTLVFDDTGLTDISAWNLAIFFDTDTQKTTDQQAFRVDIDHTLNDALTLEYGARWSSIDADDRALNADVRPNSPAAGLDAFTELYSTSGFLAGAVPTLPRQFLTASRAIGSSPCRSLAGYFSTFDPDSRAATRFATGCDRQLEFWSVNEDFLAYYGKVNLDVEAGEMRLSGNVGLRQVKREITSLGTAIIGETSQDNRFTGNTSDTLPSLSLKLDMTENWVARVGAAKVIGYQATHDINANLDIRGDGTGQGGSPALKPFKADQFDLSLDYYFTDDGVVSLGWFDKNIQSFLVTRVESEAVPGYTNPIDGSNIALVERNVNGDGGSITGIEWLYQQTYTSLPGMLSGFGVMATYAHIDSDTPFISDTGSALPQPGLSENNLNVVGHWENDVWSLRLAYNWRDEYLDSIGFEQSGIFADDYKDLSFSTRYRFTDHVRVDFQALNLLDERQRTYHSHPEATRSYTEIGKSYHVALSVTF